MKTKKRIQKLENRISELEKIVKKSKITLTDPSNTNVSIVLSVEDGSFTTDRVTTSTSVVTDNITNQN